MHSTGSLTINCNNAIDRIMFSFHQFFFSCQILAPAAYITPDATRLLTVQSDIQVCYASGG